MLSFTDKRRSEKMRRSCGAPSLCFVLIACLLTWTASCQEITVGQFSAFSAFKCDGASVCLLSMPSNSFSFGSQLQCVSECKFMRRQNKPCIGINYRQLNNVCDVFSNVTESSQFTKKVAGCQYFQVGFQVWCDLDLIDSARSDNRLYVPF